MKRLAKKGLCIILICVMAFGTLYDPRVTFGQTETDNQPPVKIEVTIDDKDNAREALEAASDATGEEALEEEVNEEAFEDQSSMERAKENRKEPSDKGEKEYKAPYRDPFATMYDSDQAFAERAESLIENAIMRSNEEASSHAASIAERSLSSNVKRALATARLDEVYLEEEEVERIELLYADTRQDRFIIKRKSADSNPVRVSEVGILSSASMKTRDSRLDFITMTDRVNPAELASALIATGELDDVEYIQPDFTMEFSSFSISVTEVSPDEDASITDASFLDESDIEKDEPGVLEGDEALEDLEEETTEIIDQDPEIDINLKDGAGAANSKDPLIPYGETEIIVGLIDTGVDIFHGGLSGYLVDGHNFIDDTDVVYDPTYPLAEAHGTHIAGIIKDAAEGANIKIMPLKVFGAHGAYTSDIIKAIEYAEANGARIINCSFGSGQYNPALEDAIAASDMLFVASVGNARSDLAESSVYPAALRLDNLISVASLNADGGFSYYSNYSDTLVDIAARGRDVYSALPNNQYGIQSGTSMAAGQVSGVAAAALSLSQLSAVELRDRILTGADSLSNLGQKVVNGKRLNLWNSINNTSGSYLSVNPEDDFDVHGYAPTPEDGWALLSGLSNAVSIATGYYHTIALMADGGVIAWGDNKYGQLGDGTSANSYLPVQVIGLSDVVAIGVGYYHSVAIKSDGSLWAWGDNLHTQLGDGTMTERRIPIQVIGLSDVTLVGSGAYHNFAIKSDASLWAWGDNTYGQLGDGTYYTRPTPVQINGLSGVVSVNGGINHSLVVLSDGGVRAFGRNNYGQLGNGTTVDSNTPVQVSGLSDVISVATVYHHSIALKSDGSIWSWGYNGYGQIGDGTITNRSVPIQVGGLSNMVQIAVGVYHNIAVRNDGSLWAWGYNKNGQIGDGTTTSRYTPVQVTSLSDVVSVKAGYCHSFAIMSDGSLWAWGYNSSGVFGNGSATSSQLLPTLISGMSIVTALSFNQTSYSATIPKNGSITVSATAHGVSGNAGPIAIIGVAYSIMNPCVGVSINSATGVVTVESTAQPGAVTLVAAYGGLKTSASMTLTKQANPLISITENKEYLISVSASDVTSFTGMTVTISYEATILQLLNIASQVKGACMSAGEINGTDITVVAVSPGSVTLSLDKDIPQGKSWAGVITVLRFKGLSTDVTIVLVA